VSEAENQQAFRLDPSRWLLMSMFCEEEEEME
jgi:hypothetical protein